MGQLCRSSVTNDERKPVAEAITEMHESALSDKGLDPVTTEIAAAGPFHYAEDYHQQYLHKVPNGYCSPKGTGVSCALRRRLTSYSVRKSLSPNLHIPSAISPNAIAVSTNRGATERSSAGSPGT